MANLTAIAEKEILNTWLRALTTAVSGSNASTSNLLVTSSTGFGVGEFVKVSSLGTYHQITAVPDGTHVTVSPVTSGTVTTGNVVRAAYSPLGVWIGLFSAAPTDAGGGTEATGGSYARVQVTQADASWAAPSGTPSSTSNSAAVTFPTSTATWGGTMTHFGIFDAASGGNLIGWNSLTTPQSVAAAGITPSFAIGALTWSED